MEGVMHPRLLPFAFLALVGLLAADHAHAGPLADAAIAGDESAASDLLDQGVPPDEEGVATPLYFAAQRGHVAVAELLVSSGANVNAETSFGTPLQIAARQNHVEIVQLLLDNGADPNLGGGEDQKTPLHDAAERGSIEAARLLLGYGADVNGRDRWNWPAIQFAARKGRTEMVAFLREMGAAPTPVDPLVDGELEAADPDEGRVYAIGCAECHALEPGEVGHGQHPGPNLVGVVGRDKASHEGFDYSAAMQAQAGSWTPDELNFFLSDPVAVVPGTDMSRGGLADRDARIAVIAYLIGLEGSAD
jgi:cytochrome c2